MTDTAAIPGSTGSSGDADIDAQIQAMDAEFQKAVAAQTAITIHKTKDDSSLDASKQRPSG
jgi:hypothetical protein